MLTTDVETPTSPDTHSSLADLSRRASVISTSSSDDTSSSPKTPVTPQRPRPIRTFTGPRTGSPIPATPRGSRAPSYLTRELGVSDEPPQSLPNARQSREGSRAPSRSRGPSVEDFEIHGELGEGAYSTVVLATYRRTKHKYAMKILDKAHLTRNQKMNTALIERAALVRLNKVGHPGIVRLAFGFHDQWSLYFVIDWAQNGELQSLISRMGSLSIECSRFYSAQIADSVRFMHEQGVIHRDLKPENVLLDEHFRIKITDFGTAVVLHSDLEPEKFAGTAQYIAPEIIVKNESSRSCDLWSYGCIVYQMIAGRFAFSGLSNYLIMEKVKKVEYTFPEGFDEEAQDLVKKLLVREPERRLGAGDNVAVAMKALTEHPFHATLSWAELWNGPVPPLEPGLVKKEHPLAGVGKDKNWEAIDAMWDDANGDGVAWEPEAKEDVNGLVERPVLRQPAFEQANESGEIGPMGETRPLYINAALDNMRPRDSSGSRTPTNAASRSPTMQATALTTISSDRTLESISDGDDEDNTSNLLRSLQALKMEEERDRGRTHAMTPVQGNGPPVDFGNLLHLPQSEQLVYTSTVEVSSLRRRASKLLRPLATPQVKPKIRQLVLTNRRIFVVKYQPRHPDDISIKAEYYLQSDKENASRVVTSVEPKGEREFVLMTASKNSSYAAPDPIIASTWTRKINSYLTRTS